MWNVILSRVENNVIKPSQNNPGISGRYLCTCVQFYRGKEYNRYLQMMEYNAEKQYWHDPGKENAVSHVILAWTEDICPCDYNDFRYNTGGYLTAE
jgi:hypothetical protein